ncbi:MAG: hypothetical protein Q8M94_19685 [Ignavibacteria bacterium]|nr:hypothetical protein [Ignavibacteria bacterium]
MDKEEMLKGLRKGVGAIVLSIEKWEDIAYRDGEEARCGNCALCWIFGEDGNCIKCPIRIVTNLSRCAGTPYNDWHYHSHAEHPSSCDMALCDKCVCIALKEIDFLTKVHYAMMAGGGKNGKV